jgi:hypothetical protein
MTTLNEQKIEDLIDRETAPIYEISTVFPFTLFPTRIKIYRNKVVVIKTFFLGRYEFPMIVEDIKTVTATGSIVFASLYFEIKGYEDNPQLVRFLWHDDAFTARRIIMGLILLKRKKITTEDITNEELVKKVEQLG